MVSDMINVLKIHFVLFRDHEYFIPVFLDDPVKEDFQPDHCHEAESHHQADAHHHPQLQGRPHRLLTWAIRGVSLNLVMQDY